MNNYKNMSDEEIKEQLEWSDHHEFSYGYSIWAFEKIKQLKKQKDDVVEYIKYQLSNLDFEKEIDLKAKILGSMIIVMLEDKGMLGEKNVED